MNACTIYKTSREQAAKRMVHMPRGDLASKRARSRSMEPVKRVQICMLAGVAACEWSMNQIDNASNEQTIMAYLTNDAKLTAQIDAANDTRSYACCKPGSNECARRSHEQLHRQLRQCTSKQAQHHREPCSGN